MLFCFFYKTGFGEGNIMEIDACQKTANQPACWVTHGDGKNFVPDPRHNKQINLPEEYKGTQHDEHGSTAVTSTT